MPLKTKFQNTQRKKLTDKGEAEQSTDQVGDFNIHCSVIARTK